MRLFNFKKFAVITALGLVAILGTSQFANAQRDNRDDQRQQQRNAKQREKVAREQAKAQEKWQSDWNRRNTQMNSYTTRQNRGYTTTNVIVSTNSDRYRVYRNGSYYNTDNRGADMLRQAVNEGYRQGFAAGRSDRDNRRRSNWSNSNVYRDGSMGYGSGVDRSQYQYYFQQGFQRGYQDGSNSRYQTDYNGNYDYGYNNNGVLNVIGSVLNGILNISNY